MVMSVSCGQVKRRNLEETAQPGTSVSEVARRYGVDRRVLCRWKQESVPPVFVAARITDAAAQSGAAPTVEGAVS